MQITKKKLALKKQEILTWIKAMTSLMSVNIIDGNHSRKIY